MALDLIGLVRFNLRRIMKSFPRETVHPSTSGRRASNLTPFRNSFPTRCHFVSDVFALFAIYSSTESVFDSRGKQLPYGQQFPSYFRRYRSLLLIRQESFLSFCRTEKNRENWFQMSRNYSALTLSQLICL